MSMNRPRSPLVDGSDRRWLLAEAHRLLRFAEGALLPTGGFAWLDDNGRPEDRPLELYITCRMTQTFSLGQALRDPASPSFVRAGVAALETLFADRAHGGWFHTADASGAVDDTKTAYDHAFVVLAGVAALARDAPGAAALLRRALQVFDEHFWDDAEGLARESFSADWSRAEPYRGANSNMHTVECLLAASDVTGDDVWRRRALRITDRVVNGWAAANRWRVPEHFDAGWNPVLDYNVERPADPFRPFGATVGHGMEWARLCVQLAAALAPSEPDWLVAAAVQLYDRARADGWARNGADGFLYTVDWDGNPVVEERMHWVAAEATAAAAALHHATGDSRYADDFDLWWAYIRTWLTDPVGGSWRHELSATNGPSATVWTGKPDVYHAIQACLIPLLPLQPAIAVSAAGV